MSEIQSSYYFPVKHDHNFSSDLLKYDLEDIDNLLQKAKRSNVIYHLKEMRSKIEDLLKSSKTKEEQKINEKSNQSNNTEEKNENSNNNNKQIQIQLKNSIKLDKYILSVKQNSLTLAFEMEGIGSHEKENIIFHCDKNSFFLVVKNYKDKDYYFIIKKLAHEINNEQSYFKTNENTLTVHLIKNNPEDEWKRIEAQDNFDYEPGPNDIFISVEKLKYLYETGSLEEKKKIREKFGDEAIQKITGNAPIN